MKNEEQNIEKQQGNGVLPCVSHSFTLNEIGDKCQKWLDKEIAKDPKDQFSNREKYWMHEAYTAGFNEAIKTLRK